MKRFAQCCTEWEHTPSIHDKRDALVRYFREARDEDKLWAIALLTGNRPKRVLALPAMKEWAAEMAGIPLWLLEASVQTIGDQAETLALAVPPAKEERHFSLSHWIAFVRQTGSLSHQAQQPAIQAAWDQLGCEERFLLNKLLSGGFRLTVPQSILVSALATYSGLEETILAHRLANPWRPEELSFSEFIQFRQPQEDLSKPYPFFLAFPLEEDPEPALGDPSGWIAEWKWDGLRSQLIVRQGRLFIWSRSGELVTGKFPELHAAPDFLPDGTVLDGAILPYKDGAVAPFSMLHARLSRKSLTRTLLAETPVAFMAFDLLENGRIDLRTLPWFQRRQQLAQFMAAIDPDSGLLVSESLSFLDWSELRLLCQEARKHACDGIVLKRKASAYLEGRRKGDWWKWKTEALNILAVLIYVQQGPDRMGEPQMECTFAVWEDRRLVPIAKTGAGLTGMEQEEISAFVRQNTLERFGPVRSVKPELVFEIAFEGIQLSTRHKSGVLLRSPVIRRWHKDKSARIANTLEDLKKYI
ncbi:MAG: cisplatin damage response ATP-dependent DNA ligase [Haliscomenobacter sp.]|nr:cisplatin damage response ATP-dependent DNA ligase [Haliscomenobacter sp.]